MKPRIDAFVHGRDCGLRGGHRMVPPCFSPAADQEWLAGYDDGYRVRRHQYEHQCLRTGLLLCMLSAFIMIGSVIILVKVI